MFPTALLYRKTALHYPLCDLFTTSPLPYRHRRIRVEIAHLASLYARTLDDVPEDGPDREDTRELRRMLYGLNAILKLHLAQEEESYLTLFEEEPAGAAREV